MSGFESPLASRLRWAAAPPSLERYVGPFATGAGLTIGGTVLGTILEGLRLSGPEALLVLGAGALAGSITVLGSTRPRPVEVIPSASHPAVPESIVCSRCSNSVPAHEWAEIVRRAWHTAGPGPRAPAKGVAASVEAPGDQVWGQWAAQEVGRLPVELVGPVPETAWIPPSVGGIVPFPDREPTLRVVDDRLVPIEPGFSDMAPETEFASTAGGMALPALLPTFQPSSEFPPSTGSDLTMVPGGFSAFEPDLSFDWITAEALHPVPPHLRTGTPPERVGGPSRPLPKHRGTKPERACASCARPLPPSVRARPCPECQKPVCLPCRTQAVVHYGQTWCNGCAAGRQWHEQIPSGRWAPEEPPAAPGGPGPTFGS